MSAQLLDEASGGTVPKTAPFQESHWHLIPLHSLFLSPLTPSFLKLLTSALIPLVVNRSSLLPIWFVTKPPVLYFSFIGAGVWCVWGRVLAARRQGPASPAMWPHGVPRLSDPAAPPRASGPLPLRQAGHRAGWVRGLALFSMRLLCAHRFIFRIVFFPCQMFRCRG